MSVPRFSAEASLYRTSGYYRTSVAFNQAGGIVFQELQAGEMVLQEFGLPVSRLPLEAFFHCGRCYYDRQGNCVQDCIHCPPGKLPNGECTEDTFPCGSVSPAHTCCPQPGQVFCYHSEDNPTPFCCPPGQNCCNPAAREHGCCAGPCCNLDCCQPNEVCVFDANLPSATCCPKARACFDTRCCPEGQLCRNPDKLLCCDIDAGPECGNHCCLQGQFCADPSINLCCNSGETNCGGRCVDLSRDPNNCGRCGNPCTGGMTCQSGHCVCPPGLTNCGGRCVDLSRDPNSSPCEIRGGMDYK
jgi:hypothetical protein